MTDTVVRPQITEFDCSTQSQTIRDLTDEEFALHKERQKAIEDQVAAQAEADAAKAAALESANAKLAKLGLTADEIAAIIG